MSAGSTDPALATFSFKVKKKHESRSKGVCVLDATDEMAGRQW